MTPSPGDVLSWIAASPPWFPARHAEASGISRASLEAPVEALFRAGLIEALDWVKGLGQGFGLTAEGERAHADPAMLARVLAGKSHEEPRRIEMPTTFDRGERARNAYYEPQRPIVTQVLMLANILVFLVGLSIAWKTGSGRLAYLHGQDSATLIKIGAVTGDSLVRGEWWRLGSCSFVHIGIIHILLNMYVLAALGQLAENLWGRWRFLLIYLVSALAGAALAMSLQPVSLLAGASGAIWGVMASLGVWILLYRQHFDAGIMSDFARRLAFAVVVNGIVSFLPGVRWQGHLGGAIGGIVMAFVIDLIRPGCRRRTIAGVIGAVAVPVLIVAGLLVVALNSKAWQPLLARQSVMERLHYLERLQPELNEASPGAVLTLMVHATKIRDVLDVPRWAKVEAEAKQLQEKAAALKAKSEATPAPRMLRLLPRKVEEYVTAVHDFTQAMIDFARGDRNDPAAIQEMRKHIEEKWRELYDARW